MPQPQPFSRALHLDRELSEVKGGTEPAYPSGEYQQSARRPQADSGAGKPGVQGREPKQFLKVDFLARRAFQACVRDQTRSPGPP